MNAHLSLEWEVDRGQKITSCFYFVEEGSNLGVINWVHFFSREINGNRQSLEEQSNRLVLFRRGRLLWLFVEIFKRTIIQSIEIEGENFFLFLLEVNQNEFSLNALCTLIYVKARQIRGRKIFFCFFLSFLEDWKL